MYKNSTELDTEVLSYECLHEVYGSDHRPVTLALSVKNFTRPKYYELARLFEAKQEVGLIEFEFMIIEELALGRIVPLEQLLGEDAPIDGVFIRVSFYSSAIDTEAC